LIILKNEEKTFTYSEKERKIGTGNSAVAVPPNLIVSPGDVISTKSGVYTALHFQPPEFGNVCRRNAQIIQPHDASYMIFRSGVRTGSVVLEAGAGSGSLSSFILWSIGSSGKLVTVDNNENNLAATKENLSNFYDLSNWFPMLGDVRTEKIEGDLTPFSLIYQILGMQFQMLLKILNPVVLLQPTLPISTRWRKLSLR